MVRAILAGTKTQTRRAAVKTSRPDLVVPTDFDKEQFLLEIENKLTGHRVWKPCPYGHPGDRLWVRETWQHSNFPLGPYDESCTVFYRADYLDDPHGPDGEKSPEGKYRHWVPSIHMFRSASRILLEITGIRVERLQGISEADSLAEGVAQIVLDSLPAAQQCGEYDVIDADPVDLYRDLWEQINGPGSWDANPWVWVIEFRHVTECAA